MAAEKGTAQQAAGIGQRQGTEQQTQASQRIGDQGMARQGFAERDVEQ